MEEMFKKVSPRGDNPIARAYHRSVVFQNNLYIVMGVNDSTAYDDMYSTSNIQMWKKHPSLNIFDGGKISARDSFGLVKHNNKVYLFGGNYKSFTSMLNDVYVSSDMINWKQLPDAPWSGRYGFITFSFQDKIWVMGGTDDISNWNDVWWTTDGVRWFQENNAEWSVRRNSVGFVYNGKVYVIGGWHSGTLYNDVWSTTDCRIWVQERSSAEFTGRNTHTISVVGQRIILHGGQYNDQVWHTQNPKKWHQGPKTLPMGNLYAHTMDYFDERLVIVGGISGAVYKDEIWESNNKLLGIK